MDKNITNLNFLAFFHLFYFTLFITVVKEIHFIHVKITKKTPLAQIWSITLKKCPIFIICNLKFIDKNTYKVTCYIFVLPLTPILVSFYQLLKRRTHFHNAIHYPNHMEIVSNKNLLHQTLRVEPNRLNKQLNDF